MPTLDMQRPVRRGSLRGRESRNQTLSTKLTETEYRSVEAASSGDGKTSGEWVRDLIMRELRSSSEGDAFLAEILGVRLLLVNVLRPLAAGQKLSPEAFDKLLDDIGSTKRDLAAKLIAERRR